MLEQDLGQEPIIVLKDLNFEVLKAMVEFMYCGETTISQECLPSLLIAAKLFKVRNFFTILFDFCNLLSYVKETSNTN